MQSEKMQSEKQEEVKYVREETEKDADEGQESEGRSEGRPVLHESKVELEKSIILSSLKQEISQPLLVVDKQPLSKSNRASDGEYEN